MQASFEGWYRTRWHGLLEGFEVFRTWLKNRSQCFNRYAQLFVRCFLNLKLHTSAKDV
jgi:hypothetical protein